MKYTDDQLNRIYDRTSGYCHICCRSSLSRTTAGAANEGRGTWSIRGHAQEVARTMGTTSMPPALTATWRNQPWARAQLGAGMEGGKPRSLGAVGLKPRGPRQWQGGFSARRSGRWAGPGAP